MLFPNWATVKFLQLTRARIHIGKPAQSNETIRIIQIAKLSDHDHAGCFLTFDEVPFEKRDQHIAAAGHESFGWKADNIIDLGDITAARGTEIMMPLWMRFSGRDWSSTFNYRIVHGQ